MRRTRICKKTLRSPDAPTCQVDAAKVEQLTHEMWEAYGFRKSSPRLPQLLAERHLAPTRPRICRSSMVAGPFQ